MSLSRRAFLATSALAATGLPRAMFGQPAQPTWDSLRDLYQPPAWLQQNRLGIFIHWGLYSIPAHINEWYARHMYTSDVAWHTAHYGPPDKFGYKDFIPLFTAENYHPAEWAQLFREAGAGFVVPVAEHHDGFAIWDSGLTRWCAGKMGPRRDLIGELASAVRAEDLIFGLSNHRMEHHTFMYPAAGVPNDQFDPRYADFYGPPQPGDMNDGLASPAFQQDWLARCRELVRKYQPQLVYFDNGVNSRAYDAVKLQFAADYYSRVPQSTIVTKDRAYLSGSISTFEKQTRAPKWIYPGPWLSDDTIGTTWGYSDGMKYRSALDIITELIELTSKGGGLLLNVSPMGDGSIPLQQQNILREIGAWLRVNSAAINGSHPWKINGEGPGVPLTPPADWRGGSSADPANYLPPRKLASPSTADYRFTANGEKLYVLGLRASTEARILSLGKAHCRIDRVTHLATGEPLAFEQTAEVLTVKLPPTTSALPYALVIEGSHSLGNS